MEARQYAVRKVLVLLEQVMGFSRDKVVVKKQEQELELVRRGEGAEAGAGASQEKREQEEVGPPRRGKVHDMRLDEDVRRASCPELQGELGVEDRELGVEDIKLGVEDRELGVEDREIGVEDRELGVEDRELGVSDLVVEDIEYMVTADTGVTDYGT